MEVEKCDNKQQMIVVGDYVIEAEFSEQPDQEIYEEIKQMLLLSVRKKPLLTKIGQED